MITSIYFHKLNRYIFNIGYYGYCMSNTHPTNKELKKRLRSTVIRMNKYEEGTIIYGVRSFNNHSKKNTWSSTGKIFTNKKEAQKYFNSSKQNKNLNKKDTILFKGIITKLNCKNKNISILYSNSKINTILTFIKILQRNKY